MVRCTIKRALQSVIHQESIMTTMSAYPTLTFPSIPTAPFFETWSNVAGLYRDAMQANTQQWVQSSASIIQEHTLRAFVAASQACAGALAKNTVEVQQQSMSRFIDANQKAVGVMGKAFTQAWMGSLQPAK
jgi:hypothetical protein